MSLEQQQVNITCDSTMSMGVDRLIRHENQSRGDRTADRIIIIMIMIKAIV